MHFMKTIPIIQSEYIYFGHGTLYPKQLYNAATTITIVESVNQYERVDIANIWCLHVLGFVELHPQNYN